jgi:hypothetical protein
MVNNRPTPDFVSEIPADEFQAGDELLGSWRRINCCDHFMYKHFEPERNARSWITRQESS